MARITIKIIIAFCIAIIITGMTRARVVWTEWTPPTTNTDGSPLTDLAGYNIYVSSPLPSPTPEGLNKVLADYRYLPILTIGPEHNRWPFIVGRYDSYQVQISAVNKRGKESSKTKLLLITGK